MRTSTETPYDAVPYKSYPYPQSHPERMATIAALYGVQPQPIAKRKSQTRYPSRAEH